MFAFPRFSPIYNRINAVTMSISVLGNIYYSLLVGRGQSLIGGFMKESVTDCVLAE